MLHNFQPSRLHSTCLSVLHAALWVQSEDCTTQAIQELAVHPYFAPFVKRNLWITRSIQRLLRKARIRTLRITYTSQLSWQITTYTVPCKVSWYSLNFKSTLVNRVGPTELLVTLDQPSSGSHYHIRQPHTLH